MRTFLKQFNYTLIGIFFASTLINIITWLLAYTYAQEAPGELALHYNPALGIDEVGSSWRLYILPALGSVGLVANIVIGRMLGRQERFFWYVAAGVTFVLNIILCISTLMLWMQTR